MNILLIEDEAKIAHYIKKGLQEQAFTVDVATDGEDGIFQAESTAYDVIIVDIMLPKINGWSVVKHIRDKYASLPILILTARDEVEDKVKGLELGADDYLVKPFSFSELLARVRSLLRRSQSSVQVERLNVADLSVNLLNCKVYRQDQLIHLTAQEFKLLVLLMRRQGEILSRTILAEHVWGMHFDCETNVVDVAIKRLRQKLDANYSVKLIHTIRGMGYLLEARADEN